MAKIVNLYDKENNLSIIGEWIEECLESDNFSKFLYMGDLFEIVDIVNGNDYDENVIWHYTKEEVLKRIFPAKGSEEYRKSKGNIRLRLINVNNLDDSSEARVYKPFLIKNKEKILENLKENKLCKNLKRDFEDLIKNKKNEDKRIGTYTFSMSRLKDSHTFWNKEYAGTNGVAIGFEKNTLKDLLPSGRVYDVLYVEPDKDIKLADDALIEIACEIIECSYNDCSNKNYFNDITSRGYTILSFSVDIHSSIFKHRTWKNERETRIVLSDTKYKEIPSETERIGDEDKKVHYEHLSKDVIASIMLGPACSEEQVEAVKDYLHANGYNGIPVSRSHAFDLRNRQQP